MSEPSALAPDLLAALECGRPGDVAGRLPRDRRDRFETLLAIYRLHTAPVAELGELARWQHHPVLAALKVRLEERWLRELDAVSGPGPEPAADPVAAIRALAAADRLPPLYKWLATVADRDALQRFLALEGGPDGGFDDLVAICQVGLRGSAKLELAVNYWDEMGNGDPAAVHTVLHERLVRALELPTLPLAQLPVSALARNALGGLLATNRWLQPEMLGALGLIELQAGPRCRLVLQAFDRLGVPPAAYDFYRVHAEVDPRHGRDWLAHALAPTVAENPAWAPRLVRGARWRSAVNAAFLADVAAMVAPVAEAAA